MINKILEKLQFSSLNEIQEAVLNVSENGQNIVLLAPTGSGKTLAFLLPVFLKLSPISQVQALVLCPSRELALQIEQVFKSMGTGVKVSCCYGGHSMATETDNLKDPPAVLIGTPGRIADHFRRGNINSESIRMLVLDEFDKSLEMGFEEDMSYVVGKLNKLEQRILTSATEMPEIPAFVGMKKPEVLNYLTGGSLEKLTIKAIKSDAEDKPDTLFKLICSFQKEQSVIFCNHREAVERLYNLLDENGLKSSIFHGGMEQDERERALLKFRNGSALSLICTDLGSRGLDIPAVKHVVHYQLPTDENSWTHRNGRTARMDASGNAWVIISNNEKLPDFTGEISIEEDFLQDEKPLLPEWETIYISAGRKDKVNKVDIAGFLFKKGKLNKEELGLIEVKDHVAFAAVKRAKVKSTLQLLAGEKLKNKRIKIEVAR